MKISEFARSYGTAVAVAASLLGSAGSADAQGLSAAALLPGAGLFSADGLVVETLQQTCGGVPQCMVTAWSTAEVQLCRNGVGTAGGCFGPNGEIIRAINRVVPQRLQPNVILGNIVGDINRGRPGKNNDVFGRNGWLRKRFFVPGRGTKIAHNRRHPRGHFYSQYHNRGAGYQFPVSYR